MVNGISLIIHIGGSLSARRAWIEISMYTDMPLAMQVALRKESVDRNIMSGMANNVDETSRSPQGERG